MKIIIIILFSIISINAYTQDSIKLEIIGDTRTFTEIFDSKYRNINYDTLSNKLLYSRVFSFADLENRNGHSNDTLNKKDFIQAYSVRRGCLEYNISMQPLIFISINIFD